MSGTWVRHARPFDAKDLRPRVAVVVAELGLAQGPTDHAIHYLPGAVTLAFSPYAENLQKWIELARRAGHEVLLDLPMEARGSDGGPQALSPALPSDQNVARLDWTLARGTGHVGIALAAGARLMESDGALRPVLEALRERGFIFLDKQPGGSPALRMGRELGLPRAGVDRALDASPRREEIDARLAEIERQARESGTAVAIVQPHAISLERLAAWHTTLENKGIAIAPVSAVLNRQRIR
jgi:polysaccharide deacetylase 2 family uncharacterized protein YibQ